MSWPYFTYEPEQGILETLLFKTLIMRSMNNKEQRQSQRTYPRHQFEMNFVLEGEQARYFQNEMFVNTTSAIELPIWPDQRRLTAAISATDTNIYCHDPTQSLFFQNGDTILIWVDFETYEVATIDSMTSTYITVTSPIAADYNVGDTIILPLRTARILDSYQTVREYVNRDSVKLRFELEDNDMLEGSPPFFTHNSKYVLEDENMVDGPLALDIMRNLQIIDNETGVPEVFSDWPTAIPTWQFKHVYRTHYYLWVFRILVNYLRGSHKSFYVPTWHADLVAADDISSGFDLLLVEEEDYYGNVDFAEPWTSIYVQTNSATRYLRDIVAFTSGGLVTVDSNWTYSHDQEDLTISYMPLCRIADDKVEIFHEHYQQATVSMNLVGVVQ